MMHDFLANNREELVIRCKSKVAKRARREATDDQLKNGVPLFLDQLTKTLRAEQGYDTGKSLRISGASGGDSGALSEIGVAAAAHGKALLRLGFTVDQVVHDYGDLCQAITELAHERDALFAVDEFHTLNRCLDNAIGATGSVLKRSLAAMRNLVDTSIAQVRANSCAPAHRSIFSLALFVQDAQTSAQMEADVKGCGLVVAAVDPLLRVEANRDILLGALSNLLGNAFKFTNRHTAVRLNAYALDDRILIDVEDRCGGLALNYEELMFKPFSQQGDDRSGLGLGLSIARQSVQACGGTSTVKNMPDVGCVFTIDVPNCTVERRTLPHRVQGESPKTR